MKIYLDQSKRHISWKKNSGFINSKFVKTCDEHVTGYRERLLQMPDRILTNPDLHNYVVLGGTSLQWIKAAIKRFTSVNLFSRSFELFWIKMPNCTPYLNVLKDLVERPEGQLVPKIDQELEWTEENVSMAFEALRSRRTAGKIVLKM